MLTCFHDNRQQTTRHKVIPVSFLLRQATQKPKKQTNKQTSKQANTQKLSTYVISKLKPSIVSPSIRQEYVSLTAFCKIKRDDGKAMMTTTRPLIIDISMIT